MENSTEIICILDKSGSMQALQAETLSGLNQFVKDQQQEEGLCYFTLVQFNGQVSTTIRRRPLQEVTELGPQDYQPQGYTALLDAVGMTLNAAIETQFLLPPDQVPARVLIFIITDGQENASRHYSKTQVQQQIRNLTAKGWSFEFFGANVDAFGEAQSLGITPDKARQWDYSRDGVGTMISEMNQRSKEFRKGKY